MKINNFEKIREDIKFFNEYHKNINDNSLNLEKDILTIQNNLNKKNLILKQLYGMFINYFSNY